MERTYGFRLQATPGVVIFELTLAQRNILLELVTLHPDEIDLVD